MFYTCPYVVFFLRCQQIKYIIIIIIIRIIITGSSCSVQETHSLVMTIFQDN